VRVHLQYLRDPYSEAEETSMTSLSSAARALFFVLEYRRRQEDVSQNGLGLEPRFEDLQTLQGRHSNSADMGYMCLFG
jgi:hypothetical protein